MSDLRKAAEMALEALSEYTNVVTSGTDPTKWDEVVDGGGPAREAIQALRQALAQPPCQIGSQCIGGKCPECEREWVDLTDEELSRLCFSKPNHPLTSNQVYGRILIAIQAFKEKNT